MKRFYKVLLIVIVLLAMIITAVAVFISPVAKNYIEKHDHELLGRSIRMQDLKINIFTGRLRATDLSIGGAYDSTTFLHLDSFDMRLKLMPLLSSRIEVPYITFVHPKVKVYQRGSEFNFDGLLNLFFSDTTTVEDPSSTPFEIGIYNIAIHNGEIFYKDLLLNATWGLNEIDLKIPGVYFSGEKTDVGAVLNFAEGGSLSTNVAYDMEKSAFDITLGLKNLALANTLPYFRQSLNVTAVDGLLSADVNIRGDIEHLLSLQTKGEASLSHFALRDAHGKVAVGIDNLTMKMSEGDLEKMKFRFESIHVGGFTTYFDLTAQGNNFLDLMVPADAAPAETATTEESAPMPDPTIFIADLEVANGNIHFRDLTLTKPFEYQISDLRLKSRNFDPAAKNDIIIDARMQKTGSAKLRWIGSVDDINNQDITLWLTNLNLKDFTPYCEHFTAYPITDGNLTFRSQNIIRNRYLDGTNHLDVFEPKVDKKLKELKAEFNVPLKLGLYILKDKKGHVKMDLPVKGSLDSPEFSYRKIVLKTIGNLLLKVVTSPFSFLSGGKDNLEYIDIEAQQYAFTSEQYAAFDKIATMLRDKPEMHILLTQRLNMQRALPLQAATSLRMAYARHQRSTDSLARINNPAAAAAATPQAAAAARPNAAQGSITMLEYEKIQEIDINNPAIGAFADSLLRLRSISNQGMNTTEKAMALYRDEAASQLAKMASMRDNALMQYMATTHAVKAPNLRIEADSAATAYAGRHRYTLAVELDGERVSPSDSTATAPVPVVAPAAPVAAPAVSPVAAASAVEK